MAGLVPAIHVFLGAAAIRRGCPGHRRAEATPSFGRLSPGMTNFTVKPYLMGCFLSQTLRMRSQTLMVRSASSRVSNHEAAEEAGMIRAIRNTRCYDRRPLMPADLFTSESRQTSFRPATRRAGSGANPRPPPGGVSPLPGRGDRGSFPRKPRRSDIRR
jgi:hypothetical protein